MHLALGRFAEAVDAFTQTEFNDTHLLLAIAYIRLGRLDKARAEVEKMMKINPTITVKIWRLGYSFPVPLAGAGDLPPFTAIGSVASAFSITNSMSAGWSGTANSLSRIQATGGVRRGRTRKTNGLLSRCRF
jgi:tetratricopeptide (TPR) repeat protein